MTTPYEAYNRGAIALAEHFDIGRVSASDFVLDHNPYPADETLEWTLFKESDDIDFEALEGREAKLVHEDGGELTFTMHRITFANPAHEPDCWSAPLHAWMLFLAGWHGDDDWKLYIKGELPTKRVTADTLEPGDIVNLHSEDTDETWEHAVCVAPGKIAVAENHRAVVLSRHLETITVTTHLGQHPAYKEEA